MELRKCEFIIMLAVMVTPLVGGAMLLTIRQRIKTLQSQSFQSQGMSYQDQVQSLETKNDRLSQDLARARSELTSLRRMTAPRQITESQENILLEQLRGVKASPVIVSAYAFEEESASYAAEIAAALRKAGWQVIVNKASMNDFKGISLGTVNLTRQPLFGLHELAQAFTAAHMDLIQREIVPDTIAGRLQDGCLLIVVGRK